MKKLSDYKGDEALELWGDLMEPIMTMLADDEVQKIYKSGKPKVFIATELLKMHKKEVSQILLRIDPTPLDGMNVVIRLVGLLTDFSTVPEIASFFESAGQEPENTEAM